MGNTDLQLVDEPIFIVGPLRSGTTMLRLMLNRHPELNCFGEFEGTVSQAKGNAWPEIHEYHNFVEIDRQMQAYDFDVDKQLDYEDLVKSFLAQEYEKGGKLRVGASVHSRMDMLPKLWPKGKYIHLLRDPRDVAKSCIGMGWVGNVYKGAKYWLQPEEHWDELRKQVQRENTFTIKYEDLVREPEKSLSALCEFLGLQYNPTMLDLEKDSTYSRPDSRYAEQWRKRLTEKELWWVESQCAEKMLVRGYEVTQTNNKPLTILSLLYLNIQNRFFRVAFNIKRYGLINWFMFVATQRIGPKSRRENVQSKINRINIQHLK